MRLHLSNVNLNSRSGPNSFAGRLCDRLIGNGHDIVGSLEEYDSMLAFIEATSPVRRGARLIQRLDGIWFKPEEYEKNNRLIKATYNSSDHVVFQSDFDRKMITHHWGDPKSFSVIHNGIDLGFVEIKNPQVKILSEKFKRVFVSSASWHRQKRLQENTELFLKLAGEDDDSCFLVLGRNPDFVVSHPRIFYTGEIDHATCLEIYRISTWMIHLAWLDHCPNVVVEALSQGCPVICSDSGGTQEIVKDNGIVIPENLRYNFELLDYDSPPLIETDISLPIKINVNPEYLDIGRVTNLYESAIFGK